MRHGLATMTLIALAAFGGAPSPIRSKLITPRQTDEQINSAKLAAEAKRERRRQRNLEQS